MARISTGRRDRLPPRDARRRAAVGGDLGGVRPADHHHVRPAGGAGAARQVLHAGSGHRGYDLGVVGAGAVGVGRAAVDLRGPLVLRDHLDRRRAVRRARRVLPPAVRRRDPGHARGRRRGHAERADARGDRRTATGSPEDKVFVIPNAVDLDRFQPRPALPRGCAGTRPGRHASCSATSATWTTSGRARRCCWTRPPCCAGRGCRSACCWWATAAAGPSWRRRAAELGLGAAAVFAGSVPFDEVPDWYAQIDLFVVPRVPERAGRMVSPMKPFEAMAMEVPVLVSDLPALVEIAGEDLERAVRVPRPVTRTRWPTAVAAAGRPAGRRWRHALRRPAATGCGRSAAWAATAGPSTRSTGSRPSGPPRGEVRAGVAGSRCPAAGRPRAPRRRRGSPAETLPGPGPGCWRARRRPGAGPWSGRSPRTTPATRSRACCTAGSPGSAGGRAGVPATDLLDRHPTAGPADVPLVVHLHWLNEVLARYGATTRGAGACRSDRSAPARPAGLAGARLVWTVHNVLPHEPGVEDTGGAAARGGGQPGRSGARDEPADRRGGRAPGSHCRRDRSTSATIPGTRGCTRTGSTRADARRRPADPGRRRGAAADRCGQAVQGSRRAARGGRPGRPGPARRRSCWCGRGARTTRRETMEFIAAAAAHPAVRLLPGPGADVDIQVLMRGGRRGRPALPAVAELRACWPWP